jgi:hypothetical protein
VYQQRAGDGDQYQHHHQQQTPGGRAAGGIWRLIRRLGCIARCRAGAGLVFEIIGAGRLDTAVTSMLNILAGSGRSGPMARRPCRLIWTMA